MSTKFCYQEIRWSAKRREIYFVGGYLTGGRGRRFQVDGLKRVVQKNECLYLCKIKYKVGNQLDDTFKIFVLHDGDLGNWANEDIQLIGKNINGHFLFDKDFFEGMKKINRMDKIPKISLSGDEGKTDN